MITINKLRERYKKIHPLIFKQSVDRAKNEVELFDILDSFEGKYPIIWNDISRRWVQTNDLTLKLRFKEGKNE